MNQQERNFKAWAARVAPPPPSHQEIEALRQKAAARGQRDVREARAIAVIADRDQERAIALSSRIIEHHMQERRRGCTPSAAMPTETLRESGLDQQGQNTRGYEALVAVLVDYVQACAIPAPVLECEECGGTEDVQMFCGRLTCYPCGLGGAF